MPGIFLSYRRSDSAGWAGRLHDSLQRLLPSTPLFMDIEDIPPGVDFVPFIGDGVARCDVLVALIGPQWLEARDENGHRRLDSPDDYTRIEIEAALRRDIRVIPVLVGGARQPKAAELPESLRPLTRRQNFELPDRGWEENCRRLAHAIEQAIAVPKATPFEPPTSAPGPQPLTTQRTTTDDQARTRRRTYLTVTLAAIAVTIAFAAGLWNRGTTDGPTTAAPAGEVQAASGRAGRGAPLIEQFLVSPQKVREGDKVLLRWLVSDADRIDIQPGLPEAANPHGTWEDRPTRPTVYVLTATGRSGRDSRSVAVDVLPRSQAPSGVFEIELWPGEGRPRFQAVASELAIHETPSSSARIVRPLTVLPGQDIAFDETRYRTTESGHLQILAATHITGRVLGPIRSLTRDAYYEGQFPQQAVACKQGDVIEYLQDRAEGTCFVRVGDQVVDARSCPAQDAGTFRIVTMPKTEWWIRVVVDRVPVGWALVDGKGIKQNGRTF